MGRKFTIFALFYFVFEGKFQVQAPPGGLFGGAIERRFFCVTILSWGAYIWRGLSSEFYGISVTKKTIIETSTWWTKIHGQYKFIVLLGTLIESTGFPPPPTPPLSPQPTASRFPIPSQVGSRPIFQENPGNDADLFLVSLIPFCSLFKPSLLRT